MLLPPARGPLTHLVSSVLRGTAGIAESLPETADPISDDDLQLALWMCYELHYRGFDEVDARCEWAPEVLSIRTRLEETFVRALEDAVQHPNAEPSAIPETLRRLIDSDVAPSLSAYVQQSATLEQFREFAIHRSVYHLKEADPHSWAIPRLPAGPKAALLEIQYDEYGGGFAERMHSELFRRTMRELGLDDSYGAYVADVPGITLAVSNVMSLFGLHRERRGAVAGHLAAFEMTSTLPNRRYGKGLSRLGGSEVARRFYDEHVEADAVHEQVAAFDLCGRLAQEEPQLAGDILFGAACCLYLDGKFAEHVLRCWHANQPSLYGLGHRSRAGS